MAGMVNIDNTLRVIAVLEEVEGMTPIYGYHTPLPTDSMRMFVSELGAVFRKGLSNALDSHFMTLPTFLIELESSDNGLEFIKEIKRTLIVVMQDAKGKFIQLPYMELTDSDILKDINELIAMIAFFTLLSLSATRKVREFIKGGLISDQKLLLTSLPVSEFKSGLQASIDAKTGEALRETPTIITAE